MITFWALLVPAFTGALVGYFAAMRLRLSGKWLFALLGMFVFTGCYALLAYYCFDRSESVKPTHRIEETSSADTESKKNIPVLDQGLQAFPSDFSRFRKNYNQQINQLFPEYRTLLLMPDLPVESGIITNAFHFRTQSQIIMTISIKKHNQQIDEITLIAENQSPSEPIRHIHSMLTASLYALIGQDILLNADISSLLIKATSRPDQLFKLLIGDIQLTAIWYSMAGLSISISRPATVSEYLEPLYYEEEY